MREFPRRKASAASIARRRPVFGFGINDAEYMTNIRVNGQSTICPIYAKWYGMIERCYNPNALRVHSTYKDAYICDEWVMFSGFSKWYVENYVDGWELDKDIKVKGNNVYSPDTCLFVPQLLNKLLNDHGARRGKYPVGVSFHKHTGKYMSQSSVDGKTVYIGVFLSVDDASLAYSKAKNSEIKRKMEQWPEFAVYLKNHMAKDKEKFISSDNRDLIFEPEEEEES